MATLDPVGAGRGVRLDAYERVLTGADGSRELKGARPHPARRFPEAPQRRALCSLGAGSSWSSTFGEASSVKGSSPPGGTAAGSPSFVVGGEPCVPGVEVMCFSYLSLRALNCDL